MRYRLKLLFKVSALLCLMLAQAASADNVVKTLYVDGENVSSTTASSALSFPYPRLTIGAEGNRWYRYNGYEDVIDEFAIYEGVLSETRIKAHYDANGTQAAYYASVTADSPKLWLKFEDAASTNGSTAQNSGSAPVDGTYIGDTTYGDVALVVGRWAATQAADFNGASGGQGTCVDVDDSSEVLSLEDVTIEMWVKTDQTTDYPRLFQHNGSDTEMSGYGAMLTDAGKDVGLIGGGSTEYVNDVNLNDGNWHHVVVTYNSAIISADIRYPAEVMADDPCLYIRFEEATPAVSTILVDPNYQQLKDYSGHNYWVGAGLLASIEKTPGSVGNAVRMGRVGGGCYIGDSPPLEGYNNGDARYWVAAARRYTEPPEDGDNVEFFSYFDNKYAFTGPPTDPEDEDNPPGTESDVTFEFWFKSCVRICNSAAFFNQSHNDSFMATKRLRAPACSRANYDANDPNAGKYDCSDCSQSMRAFTIGGEAYTGYDVWPFDGDWHHVVVAYDENTPNDLNSHGDDGLRVLMYVDTVLEINDVNCSKGGKGGPWKYASRGKVGPEMDHIMIGRLGGKNRPRGLDANPWAGYIDEFAIYQGVLPEDRIVAHYNAWQPKSCAEMRERERGLLEFDVDEDCDIDFHDFADFALDWRACNDPCDADCMPYDW